MMSFVRWNEKFIIDAPLLPIKFQYIYKGFEEKKKTYAEKNKKRKKRKKKRIRKKKRTKGVNKMMRFVRWNEKFIIDAPLLPIKFLYIYKGFEEKKKTYVGKNDKKEKRKERRRGKLKKKRTKIDIISPFIL